MAKQATATATTGTHRGWPGARVGCYAQRSLRTTEAQGITREGLILSIDEVNACYHVRWDDGTRGVLGLHADSIGWIREGAADGV